MGNITVSAKVFKAVREELEKFVKEERVTCTMQLFSYAGGFFYAEDVPYFVVYDVIKELGAKYGLTPGWD